MTHDSTSNSSPIWMLCPQLSRDTTSPSPGTLRGKWKQLRDEYKKRSDAEYGCSVAGGGFNSAVLQYLAHSLAVVSPPSMHAEVLRQTALLNRSPGSVVLLPRRQLFPAMAKYGCTAWLDAVGECAVPFHIRAQALCERQFPVIVTHHSVSYPHLATQTFLPLVSCETYPFDALVCSSSSARFQLQTLARIDYRGT